HRAVAGVRGVIHAAGWVSLGPDRRGISHSTNVELTRGLLTAAAEAGVERFVYTSTVYTLAAGTPERPADESTEGNLQCVDSPYTRSKRQGERLVLEAGLSRLSAIAICPGMVLGPRDTKSTSTTILSLVLTLCELAACGVPRRLLRSRTPRRFSAFVCQ